MINNLPEGLFDGRQHGHKVLIRHPDDAERFLALPRYTQTPDAPTTWDIPGGRQKDDETDQACILREIAEEAGGQEIDPSSIALVGVQIFSPRQGLKVMRHIYVATGVNAVSVETVRWVSVPEAHGLWFGDALTQFIHRYDSLADIGRVANHG